ncbi:MAG: TolC family protein [Opitutales bacterium]|nr:TolC family protein [Opitutales bacterium]
MPTKKLLILLGATLPLAACVSYEANPIRLEKETLAWVEASEKALEAFPQLTFADAQTLGLAFNPELNRARLQLAKSRDVEKQSGWWEDPSVSFDLKRVLNTGAQPWAYTPGVGLSVPVTGLPGLAEEAAAHYAEADYWTLVQAEFDFRSALAELWIDYAVVAAKSKLTENYLAKVAEEKSRLEKLFAIGEISAGEMQKESDRYNSVILEKRALDSAALELRSRIVQKLGLAPRIALELKLDAKLSPEIPAPVASPAPEKLAELPKIRAALANYDASETALKTEIRRQYPELSLGTSYELDGNDSFEDSLTLGIGFNLPVWNRNRVGIATAKGERALARLDAMTLWQEQFHTLRHLEREQKIAETHCREQIVRTEKFRERTQKIYAEIKIGEALPTVLSEAAQQHFAAELAACDAYGDYLKTRIRILALKIDEQQTGDSEQRTMNSE